LSACLDHARPWQMLQSSAPTRLVLLLRTRWPSFLVQSTFTPSLFGSLMRTRQGQATKTRAVQTQRTPPLIYRNPNLTLTPQLVELLNASIAINSTTFEDVDSESGDTVFIGSKTETALLKFAKDLGWANYKAYATLPTSF
jgi:magnesium-transporting ATPase (P-type)